MPIAYFMRALSRIADHNLYLYTDIDPRNDEYMGSEFFQFRINASVKDEIRSLNETHHVYLNVEALRATLEAAGAANDSFIDTPSLEEILDISAQPWEAIAPNIVSVERGEDA